MDWQPIETAPKDGTAVLVYAIDDLGKPQIEVARYVDGYKVWAIVGEYTAQPTHWMPLPAAPI